MVGVGYGVGVGRNVAATIVNGGGSPPEIYFGFNPEDKAADIILSEDNFAVQSATGACTVRSVTSHDSGKYYFELVRSGNHGSFGVCTAFNDLDTWCGNSAHALSYDAGSGDYYYNGEGVGNSGLGSLSDDDVLNVGVDFIDNTITFGINGVYADPFSFASYANLVGNPLFVAAQPWTGGTWRLRTGTEQFEFSLPGFSAWG